MTWEEMLEFLRAEGYRVVIQSVKMDEMHLDSRQIVRWRVSLSSSFRGEGQTLGEAVNRAYEATLPPGSLSQTEVETYFDQLIAAAQEQCAEELQMLNIRKQAYLKGFVNEPA